MKPPTRKRHHTKEPQSTTTEPVSWSLTEKEALLEALKRFGVHQWDKLQEAVPSKTEDQIETFIRKQRALGTAFARVPQQKASDKAPIELWQELAEDLMSRDVDYSFVMAQVMSVIGHLEPHDAVASSTSDPNYGNIYQFICALLRNEPPPKVTAIDAAVLLDVLQNLADRLCMLNTKGQHHQMKAKYKVLTTPESTSEIAESQGTSGGTGAAAEASASQGSVRDAGTKRGRRKRAASATSEKDTADCPGPAKNSLSSLNPLNIGVKYLNPKPVKPLLPTWPQPQSPAKTKK